MTRQPVRYAIIRLRPHVETEEFANVGIVLVAPQTGYLDFRLETRRIGRYTHFFDKTDPRFVRAVLQRTGTELSRIRRLAAFDAGGQPLLDLDLRHRADHLFAALVKDREGTIVYGETRLALHADPERLLDELFGHYVARDFADQGYREIAMARLLKSGLKAAGLAQKFERRRYGDELYPVNLPFVSRSQDAPGLALKPLFLGQEQPGRILDHANRWSFAIRRLRSQLPERITFAVEGPKSGGVAARAFEEATAMLDNAGIRVVHSQADAVKEAAALLQ